MISDNEKQAEEEACDDSSENSHTWIQWFCDLEGHDFFVEIDDEYIRDHFNLHGLKTKFTRFSEALRMILREEKPDESEFNKEEFIDVYQQAVDLYGLIHARFILTQQGAAMMREKFLLGEFGCCPRVLCKRQYVLPIATTEELGISRVKVFCPKCQDIYTPREGTVDIDGAYFGLNFPQAFMKFYPDIFDKINGPERYVAKLYGFKVFGKKCSNFEYKYNDVGVCTNLEEIEEVKNNIILDSRQENQNQNNSDDPKPSKSTSKPPKPSIQTIKISPCTSQNSLKEQTQKAHREIDEIK